jgi:hypothetical protein
MNGSYYAPCQTLWIYDTSIFTNFCRSVSGLYFEDGRVQIQLKGELRLIFRTCWFGYCDLLCGLVVIVLGYRSGGPGSIPGTTRKKVVGLERGQLSLVSTTEELLDRKVAAPV